jgi:hypothetical protein
MSKTQPSCSSNFNWTFACIWLLRTDIIFQSKYFAFHIKYIVRKMSSFLIWTNIHRYSCLVPCIFRSDTRQDIRTLWNLKLRSCVHKWVPHVYIPKHINSVHNFQTFSGKNNSISMLFLFRKMKGNLWGHFVDLAVGVHTQAPESGNSGARREGSYITWHVTWRLRAGIMQSEKRRGYNHKLSYESKSINTKGTYIRYIFIYKAIRRTFSTELWRYNQLIWHSIRARI